MGFPSTVKLGLGSTKRALGEEITGLGLRKASRIQKNLEQRIVFLYKLQVILSTLQVYNFVMYEEESWDFYYNERSGSVYNFVMYEEESWGFYYNERTYY